MILYDFHISLRLDCLVLRLAGQMIAIACALPLIANSAMAAELCESTGNEKTLVIIGASYAKGWPITASNGYRIVNKGVGGNQSFEMLSRFQKDVVELDPNAVIIWGFINDIFRSTPEKLEGTKDRIKRSYEAMIMEAEHHGITVIVATEVSIRESDGLLNWVASQVGQILGKTSYQDKINRHVHEINRWLVEIAESNDIFALDFHAALADANGQRKDKYATSDGSHLTAAAYDALSSYTKDAINAACDFSR